MKIGDIKYFSSWKYSDKLRGVIVERVNNSCSNFIVQPTHILLNEVEVGLKDNEIELLTFGHEGLHDSYEAVVKSQTGKIVNR